LVRIAISQAAFDAIAKTLPLGSVGYENATNEKGERLIWLDPSVVDRLRAMRGPGEELQRRDFAAGEGGLRAGWRWNQIKELTRSHCRACGGRQKLGLVEQANDPRIGRGENGKPEPTMKLGHSGDDRALVSVETV
jgi:hypothetical protein